MRRHGHANVTHHYAADGTAGLACSGDEFLFLFLYGRGPNWSAVGRLYGRPFWSAVGYCDFFDGHGIASTANGLYQPAVAQHYGTKPAVDLFGAGEVFTRQNGKQKTQA